MRLGLLRHGIAEDSSESGSDFDRRLTREGRMALDQHIELILRWGWTPTVIVHSPYVRTAQTAEQVAARVSVPLLPCEAVAHGRFDEIMRVCSEHPRPLVVGHEPTLGALLARLIGAPAGATPMQRAGFALLWLDRVPTTRPAVLEMLLAPPETP